MDRLIDLSDAEVMARAVDEPATFGEVFERHGSHVFRFVARRLGRSQAADATAEIFLRAYELRGRYDMSKSSALPWLYGIAANVVGDQLRRWSVRRRRHALGAVRQLDRPADPYEEVISGLDARALRAEIHAALLTLPPGQRAALVLYSVDGLSYAETAEVLGVSAGTVKSRIHRAKTSIRGNLSPGLARYIERETDAS